MNDWAMNESALQTLWDFCNLYRFSFESEHIVNDFDQVTGFMLTLRKRGNFVAQARGKTFHEAVNAVIREVPT